MRTAATACHRQAYAGTRIGVAHPCCPVPARHLAAVLALKHASDDDCKAVADALARVRRGEEGGVAELVSKGGLEIEAVVQWLDVWGLPTFIQSLLPLLLSLITRKPPPLASMQGWQQGDDGAKQASVGGGGPAKASADKALRGAAGPCSRACAWTCLYVCACVWRQSCRPAGCRGEPA